MSKVEDSLLHSSLCCKCTGAGNGRKQSKVTRRLRRQLNKKRRFLDKLEINRSW